MELVARLDAALAAGDRQGAWMAIDALAFHLVPRRRIESSDLAALEAKLAALATHESWEVQAAVARTAVHFADEANVSVLRSLAGEGRNQYVRQEAQRSLEKRTIRIDPVSQQRALVLERLIEPIQARFGVGARGAAEIKRAARRYTHHVCKEQLHEVEGALSAALMAIKNARLTHRGAPATPCLEFLTAADSQIAAACQILEQVAEWVNDVPIEKHRTKLRPVIEQAVAMVKAQLDNEDPVRIAIECSDALALEIDDARIAEALQNLIKNACQAYVGSAKPPHVVVRGRHDEHRAVVVITVEDSGRGMPDEVAATAFELFGTKKPGGHGFGLPHVRRIVEFQHEGTVRLKTAVGAGTTVTVELPAGSET